MKDCSKKWWHKTRKKKAHDQRDKRFHTEERRGPKMIMCNRPREKKKKKIGAEVSVHQREVGRRVVVTTNKLADMLNRLGKAS